MNALATVKAAAIRAHYAVDAVVDAVESVCDKAAEIAFCAIYYGLMAAAVPMLIFIVLVALFGGVR